MGLINERRVVCITVISSRKKMLNNEEVLSWTKKIKRKKAISLQQNLAVIMS